MQLQIAIAGGNAKAIREDKKKIISGLPSDDWYVKIDASDATKITKGEYEKLKARITGTAQHKVVRSPGTSAAYSVKGNHNQNFLQSDHHKYEVFEAKPHHPHFNELPIVFAITPLGAGRASYYKVHQKDVKRIRTRA